MQIQRLAIIEATSTLCAQMLTLNVLLLLLLRLLLLNSYGLVLHGRGTGRRHHYLVVLVVLQLNRLELWLLLLQVVHLLLLNLLLVLLLDHILLLLLLLLISTRGGRRRMFLSHRRLDVMHYSSVRRQFGFRTKTFRALETDVRRICMLSHVGNQCALLQELLPAHSALVRQSTMQLSMVHQLEFSRE